MPFEDLLSGEIGALAGRFAVDASDLSEQPGHGRVEVRGGVFSHFYNVLPVWAGLVLAMMLIIAMGVGDDEYRTPVLRRLGIARRATV